MDLRSPIRKLAVIAVVTLFFVSILCYGIVGIYFFIDGVRLQSGGGILLGLASWGGVALFSLPLWLVSTLRSQTKRIEQQTLYLQRVMEASRSEETIREISSTCEGKHYD